MKREAEHRTLENSDKKPKIPTNNVPLEVSDFTKTQQNQNKIIILLDQAKLETIKTKKGNFELLNCDDHRDLCKKLKKDYKLYRPDILHQELLACIDSPLNKVNLLKIYIQTDKNVLIEIHPGLRVPRTFKRFSGLMVQLLHKMKIKAVSEETGQAVNTTLLKVVKGPFSQYLPAGTKCYGMSCKGDLYAPNNLATSIVSTDYLTSTKCPPVCFVIGAMAAGMIKPEDHPYMMDMISISEYPLSGAAAISRILGGIEHHLGIV